VNKTTSFVLALSAAVVVTQMAVPADVSAKGIKVASERTATGFAFPESVAYDSQAQVLYVGQFGSELKPTQKDGKGRISKVSLDGKVMEEQFLPAKGDILNKPKGIWVKGNRLWVTDIDVVWVFDLKSRKGRKVELPGVKFANDPTLLGKALYVSDNRGDQLYRVQPADFLNMNGDPKVTLVFSGKSTQPERPLPGQRRFTVDGWLRVQRRTTRYLFHAPRIRSEGIIEAHRSPRRRVSDERRKSACH
jgi:hypothetical protein